jgi:TetR/AcrR family transcriptional regulator, transcriptional repressor for nem operon
MNKHTASNASAGRRGERGRPREFDAQKAAAAAAEVFWKQGYHATSIETLCDATGVLRGSLYGAFGDKHGLLVAAFENYADGAVARMKERLEADLPPQEALREALLHYTRVAASLAGRHGCFITNATLELLPGDEALRPYIEGALKRLAALLAQLVVRGQRAGAFNADLDEAAVGRFLLCMIQGLRVLGKVRLDEKQLTCIVDLTMRALV